MSETIDVDPTQYYTIVLQGNIAGFPVQQSLNNATTVVPCKVTNTLKVVIEGTTLYLTPQPNENVQVIKQTGKITEGETK